MREDLTKAILRLAGLLAPDGPAFAGKLVSPCRQDLEAEKDDRIGPTLERIRQLRDTLRAPNDTLDYAALAQEATVLLKLVKAAAVDLKSEQLRMGFRHLVLATIALQAYAACKTDDVLAQDELLDPLADLGKAVDKETLQMVGQLIARSRDSLGRFAEQAALQEQLNGVRERLREPDLKKIDPVFVCTAALADTMLTAASDHPELLEHFHGLIVAALALAAQVAGVEADVDTAEVQVAPVAQAAEDDSFTLQDDGDGDESTS